MCRKKVLTFEDIDVSVIFRAFFSVNQRMSKGRVVYAIKAYKASTLLLLHAKRTVV